MTLPETRYTRAGDAEIAYATVGDGPVDLVWAYGLMTHLELKWQEPQVATMLRQLAGFSRLVLFDRRGCGLSDRGDRHVAPTLEDRVEDVVAVLDAIGSKRASLFGVSEGCALAVLFASMHPRRTDRLILYGGVPRMVRDAAHPWGAIGLSEFQQAYGPVYEGWGTEAGAEAHVRLIAPSMAEDPDYLDWFARQQRNSVSRDALMRFMATIVEYDVDDILPAVRAPTLVLHRAGDTQVPSQVPRRVASRIPGATFLELPGADHLPYVGDAEAVVAAVRSFVAGRNPEPPHSDRQLVTLLATDASDPESQEVVRRHVQRLDGREVNGPDAAPLARFDTATRAIRCGLDLVDAARRDGRDVRVGVHTGECEVRHRTVQGPVAHVPGSLVKVAKAGEVLVTGTVRDVVPGSGIHFTAERRTALRGLSGEHLVIAATDHGTHEGQPSPDAEPPADNVFRRTGDFWTVGFDGRTVTLRDSKGMHDLERLLAAPGREHHVLDLWADSPAPGAMTYHAIDGLAPAGRAEPVMDHEAKARYRQRLADLDHMIESATETGDRTGAVAARTEREILVAELAKAYGLNGRTRRLPDEVERARKAVRRRVADALARVEADHASLGRHLRHSVRTGVYCSYAPERDTVWQTTGIGRDQA
jgi:pimeloyl-ACP methyl ester carboxylesterase